MTELSRDWLDGLIEEHFAMKNYLPEEKRFRKLGMESLAAIIATSLQTDLIEKIVEATHNPCAICRQLPGGCSRREEIRERVGRLLAAPPQQDDVPINDGDYEFMRAAPPVPLSDRALEIVKRLEEWDMLTLREDGFGMATADAPWARDLLAELRTILLARAAAPEPPTQTKEN